MVSRREMLENTEVNEQIMAEEKTTKTNNDEISRMESGIKNDNFKLELLGKQGSY